EYQSTVQFISEYDTKNVANLRYDTDQKIEIVKEIEQLSGGDLVKAGENKIRKAIDKIAEKYDISDKDDLSSWVEIYKEKGASALNFKEVTFFGTTGENSNWRTVTRTIEILGSDDVEINSEINLNEEKIAYFFDIATKEDSSKIGVINSIIRLFSSNETLRTLISLSTSVLSFLIAIFVAGPLIVGERRFFLENRTYHGTRIGRIGFLFRERHFRPILTMLLMDLYTFLWSLTIIGGIIKTYEYEMIPYILAENPQIERKKAFKLSKQMMKGNKWRSFVIDLSFYPWVIVITLVIAVASALITGTPLKSKLIAEICCAIFMMMFLNPYKTATKTELYIALRKEAIKNNYQYSEELNDKYLDLDLMEEQMHNSSELSGQTDE
ncbi:MAG: DUF975 family protein, partial [Ruminococcus sp.]|nr:DUF975 family protein [Ruminococcus sp.]